MGYQDKKRKIETMKKLKIQRDRVKESKKTPLKQIKL